MNRFFYVILSALLLPASVMAQNVKKDIRSGNKAYDEGAFQDAELNYRKALENVEGDNQTALYNLGNALYRQDNFDAASGSWAMAADQYESPGKKANAAFNLGNAMMKTQKYPEAISSYKEALRNNPGHDDARYNLEYAKKMLKQQQQDQQNQDQQNQDQQNQDQQNQDQQNQDQQNQDQQNQDQQNQDQQNQDQQNQQQQQPQQQEISREDAQRMLEALKQGEKETMEKLNKKKVKASRVKIEKDW